MLSTLTTFDQANADFYKEVLAEGLDVLNMSFGYPGPIELYEGLRGHSVAAVATGEDGEIVRFSDRCGLAANWCIAAPGLRVWAAYFGPYRGDIIRGYVPASGTSFAAPTGTRLRSGDSHGGSMGSGSGSEKRRAASTSAMPGSRRTRSPCRWAGLTASSRQPLPPRPTATRSRYRAR